MQIRKEFLILLGVSVLLLFGSLLYYFHTPATSNSPVILEDCKTIISNPDASINLVFIADKKKSEEYSSYLLNSEPFSSNQNNFNIYYIDSFTPDCSIYQGIATFCYSKSLLKKAASCRNDYIIVLDDQPTNIRSSSYLNVLSLNVNHPLSVILHEFGHAFGNLAEEYKTNQNPPRGSQNCVSDCSVFEGEGCFEECTKSSLFRAYENGVMRTLYSEKYGPFDDKILLSKISEYSKEDNALTGNAISDASCDKEKYYLLEISDTEKLTTISKSIEPGCPPSTLLEGDYSYKIYSSSGYLISTNYFNPQIFTDSPGESSMSGETYDSESFFISIPYSQGVQSLEISDNKGNTLLENLEGLGGNLACSV